MPASYIQPPYGAFQVCHDLKLQSVSCSKPAIRQNSRGMLSIVEKYGGGITAGADSIPRGRMLSGCRVIKWDQVFIMVVYREKETAFCFMKRGLGTRHSSMIYTLQ